MDWFRKHWADALLVLAVFLVVSGLMLTLLSGVNFNPLALVGLGEPAPAVTQPRPAVTGPAPAAPGARDVIAPLPPAIGAAPPPAQVPPAVAPAPPLAPVAVAPGGAFRIAAGAFGQAVNAEALAGRLRAAGYAVTLEPAGSLTGVFVGPYATRAEADAAAAAIQRAEQVDTLVLAIQGRPVALARAAPVSPPPGQVYIQVLAVRSQASADQVAADLIRQGFRAERRGPGVDGLHRVVVGPVAEADLATVRDRLREAGYPDAYPVR